MNFVTGFGIALMVLVFLLLLFILIVMVTDLFKNDKAVFYGWLFVLGFCTIGGFIGMLL